MAMFSFVLVLFCLASSWAQTPTPSRPQGYLLTSWPTQPAEAVIEAFYDHLCPDSKENWEIFRAVAAATEGTAAMIVHTFPLPYHHNAYFAQIVGEVVRREKNESFPDYVQLIFDNQDTFVTGSVNMTELQVQASLANLTANALGINQEKIMSGFKDEVIVERSRYAWKYAASRGVSGTPAILWNGELLYPDTANTRVPYVEKLAT